MDRADATTYLTGLYGTGTDNLLGLAGVAATDTTGGLKEPIDEALALLGVAWSELATATVTDADAPAALALLRTTTLRRVLTGLNDKTKQDLEIGEVKLKGSQLVAKVERLLADAQAVAARYSTVGEPATWAAGGINLDYLELGS
jgi:nucleotide-binding universal stress UspA family protein